MTSEAKIPAERVSKLDAARRQLRTAIRMFFEGRDTVSAYTLAAAAEGVLDDLVKRDGKRHPIRESDIIRPGKEGEFNRVLHRPQNFFKHADSDPDDVLEFRPLMLEHLLFLASMLYMLHTGRTLREGWIFFIWFGLKYPDLVRDGALKSGFDAIEREFPGLNRDLAFFLQLLNRADVWPNTD